MTLWERAFHLAEQAPISDSLIRMGIRTMVSRTSKRLAVSDPEASVRFIQGIDRLPIAVHTDAANEQHYELPPRFYEVVLGPQHKYSCCYYPLQKTTLADAEEWALALTAEHAGVADGQSVLDLGCGWGSLSLWMARRFPNARILAVSNAHTQREYIQMKAWNGGLTNLEVATADMNVFASERKFDRIVSVEMFEHMANWRALLGRCRNWLAPGGRMFVHVFTHRSTPYRFNHADKGDWIAQHFFTGGCMPSRDLIRSFPDIFEVQDEWLWDGTHYARTAEAWLANLDANKTAVARLFDETYGDDAALWQRRWRFFFLATAGLFGFDHGREWGVTHYLLKPACGD